jgi:hypothetical protein
MPRKNRYISQHAPQALAKSLRFVYTLGRISRKLYGNFFFEPASQIVSQNRLWSLASDGAVATASTSRSGLKHINHVIASRERNRRDGLHIPVGIETVDISCLAFTVCSRDGLYIPVGIET